MGSTSTLILQSLVDYQILFQFRFPMMQQLYILRDKTSPAYTTGSHQGFPNKMRKGMSLDSNRSTGRRKA
jgi:hypothetical protein